MKNSRLLLFAPIITVLAFSCKKENGNEAATICQKAIENWEIISLPFPDVQGQNDVFFLNDEMGYTVGNAGTILKTTDGGEDWKILEHYYSFDTGINKNAITDARLMTVFFVDEMVGFAAGYDEYDYHERVSSGAVFLKTTDGGDNWTRTYLTEFKAIHDLHFFDEQNGIGIFRDMENRDLVMVKTDDAGATWEEIILQSDNVVRGTEFHTTPSYLMVLGTNMTGNTLILRSGNRGESWQILTNPPNPISSIYFLSDEVGFVSCPPSVQDTKIFKTTNGGNTWQPTDAPINFGSFVHFRNPENGFVINEIFDYVEGGGEITAVLSGYEVFQTFDGGETWDKNTIEPECDFSGKVFSPSPDLFYCIGSTVNRIVFK